MQPHRYSRLATLFEPFCTCFNDADTVMVAHVYPAGEAPIAGADRDSLVQGMRARGHRQVIPLDGPRDIAGIVRAAARPATSWCSSAPATSRNGPMRCRASWRRWARWRDAASRTCIERGASHRISGSAGADVDECDANEQGYVRKEHRSELSRRTSALELVEELGTG